MDRTDQSGPKSKTPKQRERASQSPLADRVYDKISVRIASGEFKPNTKLPSET